MQEIWIHLAPNLIGRGVRIFDDVERKRVSMNIVETVLTCHTSDMR